MYSLPTDEIFVYLAQRTGFTPDVAIASELEISIPVAKKCLKELGDVVESDGDGSWRIAKTTVVCGHDWEFSPAPNQLGFIDRCQICKEVRNIETSDRLAELIEWLRAKKQEFEDFAGSTKDETKRTAYLDHANTKQNLINQVEKFKAIALEQEKEKVLRLQGEIKELTRQFFVGVGDRLKEIISQKLYKSLGYNTSAVYCKQELGITARQAQHLMVAAEVYHDLENTNRGSHSENAKTFSHFIMPTTQSQCLALAKIPKEERPEFLRLVADSNNGKIPSIRKLEKIIKESKKTVETPAKYQVDPITEELPVPKLETITKYGKPIKFNIALTNPEIAQAFEKYIKDNGIASFDGAIARLLGLE